MTTLFTPKEALTQQQRERVFELELSPHLDAVYAFANRLTNDATRAEDLAQETFMKAWRFLEGYTAGTNAKAWLFRICKNVFINEYRSIVRQPRKVDYDEIVSFHNEDEVSNSRYVGLQEEMGDHLLGDEVMRAIQSLSPAFRDVLLLDLEDFSYDEIAKLTDAPIGTVRSRLHRARGLMADQLRTYARDYGYGVQDKDTEQAAPSETAISTEGNQGEVAAPNATIAISE